MGLDSDSGDESFGLTATFIDRVPYVWPNINIVTPYGGTPMHTQFAREGRLFGDQAGAPVADYRRSKGHCGNAGHPQSAPEAGVGLGEPTAPRLGQFAEWNGCCGASLEEHRNRFRMQLFQALNILSCIVGLTQGNGGNVVPLLAVNAPSPRSDALPYRSMPNSQPLAGPPCRSAAS